MKLLYALATMMTATIGTFSATAAPTVIHASVISADDQSTVKVGVYEFDTDHYAFTPLLQSINLLARGGAIWLGNNQYLSICVDDDWYDFFGEAYYSAYAYNTTSWSLLGQYTPDQNSHNTATALSPVSGKVYGCFKPNYESDSWYFGSYDDDNLESKLIADLSEPWLACDFDADDTLYALSRSGELYTVDIATGHLTTVANTAITANELGGGAIDRVTGKFYVANRDNLYSIDLKSYAVDVVYQLTNHEQIVGWYIAANGTVAPLPSAVTDLTADFNGGATGSVTFTLPSSDESGNALTGQLTYQVSVADEVLATGSGAPSERVTVGVTLPGAGIHNINVTVSDGISTSPAATVSVSVSGRPEGVAQPPYTQTFDNEQAFNTMTVIDGNNDGMKWIYWNQSAYAQFSGTLPSDEYLLTPQMWLEAGNVYIFECDMWQRDKTYDEDVDVVYCSPTALTVPTVLSSYHLNDGGRHHVSVKVQPAETGVYHVGLHLVSPKNKYGIYADDFALSAPISLNAPAAQGVTATPAFDGSLTATISVTPSFTSITGEGCEVGSIELYRNDELINVFESVTPGTALEFTDNVASSGLYTWKTVGVNGAGRGEEARISAYVGVNLPGAASNVVARETTTPGEVTVTWDAPTVDNDGNAINPQLVKYMVAYRLSTGALRIMGDDVEGTTLTATVRQPDDSQEFMNFLVFCKTSAGINDWDIASSETLSVGAPYALPYSEHFGETPVTYMTKSSSQTSVWRVYSNMADQDGNRTFLFFDCYRRHSGEVTTGKIAVTGNNPGFSFGFMSFADAEEEIVVSVSEDGHEFTPISTVSLSDGGSEEWASHSVSLSAYKGKNVYVRLSFKCIDYHLGLDNFYAGEMVGDDLAVTAISVPSSTFAGVDTPIKVEITNNGVNDSGAFTIDMYKNGELMSTRMESDLAPQTSQWYAFYDRLNIFESSAVYYAVVTSESDTDNDNNYSAEITLDAVETDLPSPTDLKVSRDDASAVLSWKEPVFDLTPVHVTDGVDDYTIFSSGLPNTQNPYDNVGDWTMVDGDGHTCMILQQGDEYAIFPNANSAVAFVVFDITQTDISEQYHYKFLGHSSAPVFAAFSNVVMPNDDWLISPALSGEAQTVSLFAKSAVDSYGLETFELLVSSTGTNPADFTTVKRVDEVPVDWTEYTFDLPAGSKYFAIHYDAYDRYMLLVDDFSFEKASRDSQLDMETYRIYRNREFIGNAAEKTMFTDPDYSDGDVYHATALYNAGESRPTNEAGVSAIEDVAGNAVEISVINRTISVNNPGGEEIAIYDAAGRALTATTSDRSLSVTVAPGVYLIKSADRLSKVAIR